jgi:hypothetical protein
VRIVLSVPPRRIFNAKKQACIILAVELLTLRAACCGHR